MKIDDCGLIMGFASYAQLGMEMDYRLWTDVRMACEEWLMVVLAFGYIEWSNPDIRRLWNGTARRLVECARRRVSCFG